MIIPFSAYIEKLGKKRIQDIAGIKFSYKQCTKSICKRNGFHDIHNWIDTSVIFDYASVKIGKGLNEDKDLYLPIRWYNIQVAYQKIIDQYKSSELAAIWYSNHANVKCDYNLASEALDYSKKFFLKNGKPQDISNENNSYANILKEINSSYRKAYTAAYNLSQN